MIKPAKIKFVGGRKGFEPVPFINNGDLLIELPEDQSKPFRHPQAALIVRLLPELYKPVRAPGASTE